MTNHFQHWLTLALFSAVSLTSMTNLFAQYKEIDDNYNQGDWTTEQRWVVSVAATSFILSFFGMLLHLLVNKDFAGKNFEFGAVLMILGMWCAGLPTILDHKHVFAVWEDEIAVHNMFFASWGALIVSLMLFTNHFRRIIGREQDKNVHHWIGLCAAGLVVLGESSRLYKDSCKDSIDNDFCRRNVFGLVLGGATFIISGTAAVIPMSAFLEQGGALFLFVAWCFGFAYLTFETGTAVTVGSIYFAIWAAVFFSMSMVAPALFDYVQTMKDTTTTPPAAETVPDKSDVVLDPKTGGAEIEEEEIAAEIP